jgi:SIR2-like domain
MAVNSSIFAVAGIAETPLTDVIFLAGAGISYPPPTRLPTVALFVEQVIRHCTESPEAFGAISRILRSRASTLPRFEVLVEAIGQLGVEISSIGSLFNSLSPNLLHRYLAQQCETGAAVVTTNFDNCLERALHRTLPRIVFRGIDLEIAGPLVSAIVKPHGSNPLNPHDQAGGLVVSIRALARTAKGFQLYPVWRSYLRSLFSDRVVVAIGYSGSDDFDITSLLIESQPRILLWVDYAPGAAPLFSPLSAAPESVRNICESHRCFYLQGDIGMIAAAAVSLSAGPGPGPFQPAADRAQRMAPGDRSFC